MTSEQWEEATEVDIVAAKPERDTEPSPPPAPSELEHEVPKPVRYVPRYVGACSLCDGWGGDHDPACPNSKAVAP